MYEASGTRGQSQVWWSEPSFGRSHPPTGWIHPITIFIPPLSPPAACADAAGARLLAAASSSTIRATDLALSGRGEASVPRSPQQVSAR